MSADILQFVPRAASERDALVSKARSDYDSVFPATPPTTDGGKARILRRRDHFFYRTPNAPITDHHDDLIMHRADTGMPSDVAYHAPESDPA